MKKKTVGIVGCGALGSLIGESIKDILNESWELVGVYNRSPEAGLKLSKICDCPYFSSLEDLLETKPDVIVEATTVEVLKKIAVTILNAGSDLIPLAIGAFSDEAFKISVEKAALRTGRKVHIVSGAIGGFDFIQTMGVKGAVKAKIISTKSPESLQGAPGLTQPLPLNSEKVAFSGNAKEAIKDFPKNVNVAVALSLATNIKPEHLQVEIKSVPNLKVNTHYIIVEGDLGTASFQLSSKPSMANPKSSETAAYSVVAKLKNMNSPISFL